MARYGRLYSRPTRRMRYKKRGGARTARRNRRRKQVRNRTTVPVGLGFPKKMVMTHKYSTAVLLPTTVGALATYSFSCNGMFDPDVTSGTTLKPMYFNQMAALYDHYTVIGSKCVIRACNQNSTFGPGTFGVYINDDTTVTPANVDSANEQSSASHVFMAANSNNIYFLTKKWSAKKTFGGSVLGNDNLQGTTTTNPTEQSYYTIYVASAAPGTTDFDTAFEITISYIAVWDELRDITGST